MTSRGLGHRQTSVCVPFECPPRRHCRDCRDRDRPCHPLWRRKCHNCGWQQLRRQNRWCPGSWAQASKIPGLAFHSSRFSFPYLVGGYGLRLLFELAAPRIRTGHRPRSGPLPVFAGRTTMAIANLAVCVVPEPTTLAPAAILAHDAFLSSKLPMSPSAGRCALQNHFRRR